MGDRISISFKNGKEESVALFSHWDGMEFYETAIEYVTRLKDKVKGKQCTPIERLEPNTVMVDFIRHYLKLNKVDEVESNYYLGVDGNDGDNSDNGHYDIDITKEEEK